MISKVNNQRPEANGGLQYDAFFFLNVHKDRYMKHFFLFFSLTLLFQGLFAQAALSDSSYNKFSYVVGIGVSSQFTTDVVSHIRTELQYSITPKTSLIATVSYTPKSVGDTFAIYSINYFNDGEIIGNTYLRSAVTRFSMSDFSIAMSQNVTPNLALRIGPGISRLIKTEHIYDIGYIEVSSSGSTRGSRDLNVRDFEGIRRTLLGIDIGMDVTIYKRFSLNYTSSLRFTDVTRDITYGHFTDRIMKHNLSLNYTIK